MIATHRSSICSILFILLGMVASICCFPSESGAQVVAKKCGSCGASVWLGAQVGNQCPNCRVLWTDEEKSYSSSSTDSTASTRWTPWNAWAYSRFLHQQQQELIRRSELEQRRTQRVEAIRRLEDREVEKREENRDALIAKTIEFRASDNRQQRAEHFLASGLECEDEGDRKSAIAYYNLIVGMQLNGVTTDAARNRLARLASNSVY